MKWLFVLLLIASCKIENGYIIEKKMIPSHSYTYTTFQSCGKTQIPIIHTGWKDDAFVLTIKNKNETNEIEVDECMYSKWMIGEWYDKNIKK